MEGRAIRTAEQRPSKDTIIKPGELVDVVEMTPLTLTDRRIYNLLLANAWKRIEQPVEHVIEKAALRGTHKGNERIGDSIERLMASIVRVRVVRDGEAEIERVALLGSNTEHENPDGLLRYHFPDKLRHIIKESTVFARLQKEIVLALSSKYALALYEMVQKRGNLSMKHHEEFTVEELRGYLGVPKGRLTNWGNLKQKALDPAVKEVTALSDFEVTIEPVKEGRKVVAARLGWKRKEWDALAGVERELSYSKVGRKARIEGKVDQVALPGGGIRGLETSVFDKARQRFPGFDPYFVEQEWRAWASDKEPPENPEGAFLSFFQRYAERHPLG